MLLYVCIYICMYFYIYVCIYCTKSLVYRHANRESICIAPAIARTTQHSRAACDPTVEGELVTSAWYQAILTDSMGTAG